MFRRLRIRAVVMALLVVPGLMWVAPETAVATSSKSCAAPPKFDPSKFPSVPKVNNKYLPWSVGMQFVLDGFVMGDDGLLHRHRIETTVTNLTKVVGGVRTLVVFDVDIQDGVLQESEVFFQAQSADGTVWNVGEYPEEYENGVLAGAPSTWMAGIGDAKPGFGMLARPVLGTAAYAQGIVKSVGFFDCAVVFATGQKTCVPVRCYDKVLVTDEWAPPDPAGGHQRKLYAPGVGTIRVEAVGGVNAEALVLTQKSRLCGAALAAIRNQVVAQDARGYTVSPRVYGRTPRVQATLPVPC